MDEQRKYEVIKGLIDHPDTANKDRAALIPGCTKRHINRMIQGFILKMVRHSLSMVIEVRSLLLLSVLMSEVRSLIYTELNTTRLTLNTIQSFLKSMRV